MEVWDIFRDCKSGIDFENTVVKFLRCLAFEANRTGKDDGGIDIVATTSILSTKYTFYIQCKYFNTPLGKHPIQEVYAGTNYYGGNGKPVVITNNKVTVDARVYAKRLGVEIIADAEWVELKQVFKARKLINPNPHKGMLGIILARVCNNQSYLEASVQGTPAPLTNKEQLKLEIINDFEAAEEYLKEAARLGLAIRMTALRANLVEGFLQSSDCGLKPGIDTLQETNCFINLSCGRGIEISVAVAGNGDAILPQLVDKFAKLGSTQP